MLVQAFYFIFLKDFVGWGRVMGGNGDNYNTTTIKERKKIKK